MYDQRRITSYVMVLAHLTGTCIALWTYCDLNYSVRKPPWAGSTAVNKNCLVSLSWKLYNAAIMVSEICFCSPSPYLSMGVDMQSRYWAVSPLVMHQNQFPWLNIKWQVKEWRVWCIFIGWVSSILRRHPSSPTIHLADHLLEGDEAGWWQLR